MLSIDQLPVIDAATGPAAGPAQAAEQAPGKGKRRKKADEADLDYARAMGIRAASMEFHLVSLLRYYTLEEVISYWWQAQTTVRQQIDQERGNVCNRS